VSLQRLTRLIGNVLDTSQLAVGQLALHPEEFELGELASDVARRLAESAERAGCSLHVRTEPARGRWDRDRMDQVITNLLSNAVKFGAGRPVELSTRCDETDAYLTVRDAGVGIAPEDQARVFQRFERASSSRQYPGLGLGLWISRAIVEQHGGELALESSPGRGSVFTVRLPL
jgi:signal transduction histidine kinase